MQKMVQMLWNQEVLSTHRCNVRLTASLFQVFFLQCFWIRADLNLQNLLHLEILNWCVQALRFVTVIQTLKCPHPHVRSAQVRDGCEDVSTAPPTPPPPPPKKKKKPQQTTRSLKGLQGWKVWRKCLSAFHACGQLKHQKGLWSTVEGSGWWGQGLRVQVWAAVNLLQQACPSADRGMSSFGGWWWGCSTLTLKN